MAKVKYYYDSDTLSYRKIELRKRDKFRQLLVFMAASALMGGLMVLIMYQFVESPRQKVLKREQSLHLIILTQCSMHIMRHVAGIMMVFLLPIN